MLVGKEEIVSNFILGESDMNEITADCEIWLLRVVVLVLALARDGDVAVKDIIYKHPVAVRLAAQVIHHDTIRGRPLKIC